MGHFMLRYLSPVLALGLFACSAEPESPTINTDALEAASAAAEVIGLPIGSQVPDIRLQDARGQEQTWADFAGENGTVVYFNRSLDWCPFCQVQVMDVNAAARRFEAEGYGVVVITYDPVETLRMFSVERMIGIPLLSDPESDLVDAFDIRDPVYTDPESMAYGVPYPITFVIDPDGVITGKYWHEPGLGERRGYRERITVDDVIGTLAGN